MFTLTKKNPAKQLRVLMAERDINVNELSHMTGISVTTISGIRSGRVHRPRRSTADALCEALNVHIEDLFPRVY